MAVTTIVPSSTVARALDALRQGCETEDREIVVDGRLLPERDLTDVLGVNRRALRQALDIMEAEGLIVRRQGQGTFLRRAVAESESATSLSVRTSPVEILEARRGLEPLLARLAALRATPLQIDRMTHFVDRGRKAKTGREYEKWDSELHLEIAKGANNQVYLAFFELIVAVRSEQGWSNLRDSTFSAETRDTLVAQHVAIVAAIAQRDPDRAESMMREHLTRVSILFGV